MKRIDVVGKSKEEIERLLAKTPRKTLLDIVAGLASLEPHLTVVEFAARRRLTRNQVIKMIRDRKIPGVHVPTDRGDYRISLSGALEFDRRTAIS